jgi:hypothetical protein
MNIHVTLYAFTSFEQLVALLTFESTYIFVCGYMPRKLLFCGEKFIAIVTLFRLRYIGFLAHMILDMTYYVRHVCIVFVANAATVGL